MSANVISLEVEKRVRRSFTGWIAGHDRFQISPEKDTQELCVGLSNVRKKFVPRLHGHRVVAQLASQVVRQGAFHGAVREQGSPEVPG